MNLPWIRRIAIALAALLALLAVAATVLVATFDANRYKSVAIDWMKQQRQRTLAIDGPIELSVWPRLAVKVSKVRLSERGRDDEFVAVDEAALALQLLPLLGKQVVIDRVSARGVRAVYTRNAKGVSNIGDLLAADSAAAAPGAADAGGGAALQLAVSAVQLDDVQLRLRDEVSKLDGQISLHSFTSGRLADRTETPVALRASLDLTRPQVAKLALEGRMRLTPDLDRKTASLSGLTLDAQGDVAGVKALALKLEAKKLVYSPGSQALELDALKLALSGRRGSDPFELALDWPQLAVDAQRLQGSALSGRFKLAGPTALAGTLRSAAPSGRFDALRLPGVAATLAGSAGQRKIDGNAKADVVLRLGDGAVAFERLEATASIAEAGRPPLQLALRGHAGADGKGAQWALEGTLNTNRFDSSGSAAFGVGIPSLKASARFDSLDLNQLLAPDKPAAAAAPAALPADSAVPFDALRSVNGQFTLAAGALAYRQFRVAETRLDATLDNGALRVSRLAGRAWGGSFDASGSADARSRRVAVRLVASGVNVNALLKDVAGKDLLEGNGRVSAELASGGATLGALRANLGGKVALQIRDGAIKGINLARSLRQAKAALSLKQDALTQARATEKTDFSELSASAQIAEGVAHSDDLDLKSPFLRIGGAGRVDIGRSSIDYTARATVVAAPSGQDAGDLAALRGLTVPVRLTGPLEAIDWKIQWSAVAAAALQSQLKQRLAEQLGSRLGTAPAAAASAPAKPRDKLKDALKGLFK